MSSFIGFCEGDTRNRWRDGQVCPDVDKELWSLEPDGSGMFWRSTSVSRCGQGTMAPWARRLGTPGRKESREKRKNESGRENGRKEEERRKRERGDGKRVGERESDARLEWKKGLSPEIGEKKDDERRWR
ncbi:hypothetical protein TNCV_536711 [Trichonephila clavipes]|nr:hypothetical protein TNCV_536711 [Trichonephila clavipes]